MELEKFDIEKAKAGRKVVNRANIEVIDWAVLGTYICYITDFSVVPFIVNLKGESHEFESRDLLLAPEERYVLLIKDKDGHLSPSRLFYSLPEQSVSDNANATGHTIEGTYKLVKV